jgi:hypothetical protein
MCIFVLAEVRIFRRDPMSAASRSSCAIFKGIAARDQNQRFGRVRSPTLQEDRSWQRYREPTACLPERELRTRRASIPWEKWGSWPNRSALAESDHPTKRSFLVWFRLAHQASAPRTQRLRPKRSLS